MATINSQNITTYIYKYSKFILNGFEEFVLKSKDIIWEHFAIKMLKRQTSYKTRSRRRRNATYPFPLNFIGCFTKC